MLSPSRSTLHLVISIFLAGELLTPSVAFLSAKSNLKNGHYTLALADSGARRSVLATQSSRLKILGPDKKPNPVVNKDNQIQLRVFDTDGQEIKDELSFESG